MFAIPITHYDTLMTESADLLAAIAAAPADDLPRLVFADWLDDCGEPAYAQFIRDQIRLAQVPQWDPLAVRARHQLKDSLGIGRPFFGTLPQLPIFLKWHPEKAFRRGFGSGVVVHQLSGLLEAGPQLFDLAPVEELWLSAATLDDWRQLAKSPWLKHVRKLHFHFSQGLHEPIRCLAESKYAHNIDEIWFDTLETPAAGLVIEALAQSPLAGQLKGLHLRLVHTPSLPEVIAALAKGKIDNLERLSMVQAGLGADALRALRGIGKFQTLREVDLSYNPIMYWWDSESDSTFLGRKMHSLRFDNCTLTPRFEWTLLEKIQKYKTNIFMLSVKGSTSIGRYLIASSLNGCLTSINAELTKIKDNPLDSIINGSVWQQFTEFNWADNRVSRKEQQQLRTCAIPQSLTVCRFSKPTFSNESVRKLESHFGDRLVWAADDAPTGLGR